jgi:flavin-dependent dehydrogenase
MSHKADYDTIIIGAGPAGSSAAITLARAGRRVALFERSTFPRSKVCGGCLSASGTVLLQQLLPADHHVLGIKSSRLSFVMGNYRLQVPTQGRSRLVPRSELDQCLANVAASEGAELFMGHAARLDRDAQQWSVHSSSVGILCANNILLATGSGTVPRQLGIAGRSFRRQLVGQQWLHSASPGLPAMGEVELHWLRGGYVGLATPTQQGCIVAIAADVSVLHHKSPWQRLWELNPHAGILHRLGKDAACEHHARGCAGFPWLPQVAGCNNVLLLGDLVGYAEPYSGEGIGLALLSGRCAARAILSTQPTLGEYTRLIRRFHRPTFWRTHLSARVLSSAVMYGLANARRVVPESWLSRIVHRFHMKGAP